MFRRSLNVIVKSIRSEMRANIKVKEILRDTKLQRENMQIKKYSNVESRKKFGTKESFSKRLTQGSVLVTFQKSDSQTLIFLFLG